MQPGLMGFMNMLLNPLSGGQTAGQSLLGTVDAQALVEKIAASLNLDPSDPAALLEILRQAKLQDNGLAAENEVSLSDAAIKLTLTSDLAASVAADVQTAVDAKDGTTAADIDQLAKMLNEMEPGGDAAPLDPGVLEQLKKLFESFIAESGTLNKEQLAQLKEQATAFLQSQGVPEADLNQYLTAVSIAYKVDMPLTQTVETVGTPAAPATEASLRALKEATGKQQEAAAKNAPAASTNTPPEKAQADSKPAPARHDVPVQDSRNPGQKSASAASNLTLVNAIASDDAGYTGYQASSDMGAPAMIRAETGSQGVVNYMNNARTMSAHMTQMITLQIQQNLAANVNKFSMQLHPAELGRLDVQMKFEKDGTMKAHLTAERPETLSMLQRDQNQLNRILQQAGLDVDENSLSFDLRQNNPHDFSGFDGNGGTRTGRNDIYGNGAADTVLQAKMAIETAGYISQSGVNIVV